MKRITLIFIVLFTQAAWGQDWAQTQLEKSPRHREWVTVKHDGRSVETFVVYPEVKTKAPVVILIHEIIGLSDFADRQHLPGFCKERIPLELRYVPPQLGARFPRTAARNARCST